MFSPLFVSLAALLALTPVPDKPFALRGRVLDPTQTPVSDARLTAVPTEQPAARSVRTDLNGEFSLNLAPGDYTVTVSASGFMAASVSLHAISGEQEARDFVLKLAPRVETVTVRGNAGYQLDEITSGTRTPTPLRDVPQSITVVTREQIRDQLMLSIGDVMRYAPGVQVHQGENNRDQVIIRGNSSSADFFVNGVRDDMQYYRDLYNVDRVEALRGPNAMMFGRGGGGGVVNRVTKEARFQSIHNVTLQGGAHGHRRIAGDWNEALADKAAVRLNAMYEDSGSFRKGVTLERYAFNPMLTLAASERTSIALGYERLHDTRVADRGITSFQGRPAEVDVSTFYGNPADSHVRALVNLGTAAIEHTAGGLSLRNRTMFGAYDRSYQNYVPGAVTTDRARVALTAYGNQTSRQNVFNQSDLICTLNTGAIRHTLLAGVEIGRQITDNFRKTGFFNDTAATFSAPYENPTISTPVTFRPSATDADNHVETRVAAVYAQDQVEFSPALRLVGGLRFDRFDLEYHNNRNGETLGRVDDLLSPRVGLVWKPVPTASLYGSYTVSYLPSSGDQFSALTTVTEQVKPEKFNNYEVGGKWEPHAGLALNAALYRLDRTNTRSSDPNDATRIVQTGSQRTTGLEIGIAGHLTSGWQIAGGYSQQNARVTRATTAARAGAKVPQVPGHALSLWNNWQAFRRLGTAVGIIHRGDVFATIDNTVKLPGYTRVDLAAFYTLSAGIRVQANLENALGTKYWSNADSNTNISPGSGRALRMAITAAF